MSQDDLKLQVKMALDRGETATSVADRFGVSRRTVTRWIKDKSWPEIPDNLIAMPKRSPSRDAVIVDNAISHLDRILADSDARSGPAVVTALIRALEYRRKIQPPTLAELAEQAIVLGVSPQELARAIRHTATS